MKYFNSFLCSLALMMLTIAGVIMYADAQKEKEQGAYLRRYYLAHHYNSG
jgi:hypothetical protein